MPPEEDPNVTESSDDMLFNLTTRQTFKIKDLKESLPSLPGWGPQFGNGDLQANEPFNRNRNC